MVGACHGNLGQTRRAGGACSGAARRSQRPRGGRSALQGSGDQGRDRRQEQGNDPNPLLQRRRPHADLRVVGWKVAPKISKGGEMKFTKETPEIMSVLGEGVALV